MGVEDWYFVSTARARRVKETYDEEDEEEAMAVSDGDSEVWLELDC